MIPADADTNPYATHLDILRALEPERVLEFGPGYYSTALFLSMPKLERLVSIEHDHQWRKVLRAEFSDPRWELRTPAQTPSLRDFDLVLIDDGESEGWRVDTIRKVLSGKHPRVVIHDAEVAQYREAIGDKPHFIYRGRTPQTAVVLPSES